MKKKAIRQQSKFSKVVVNQNFFETGNKMKAVSGRAFDRRILALQNTDRTMYVKVGVDPERHIKKRMGRFNDKPTRKLRNFADFRNESETNGPCSNFGSGKCLFINEDTGSALVFLQSASNQLKEAETWEVDPTYATTGILDGTRGAVLIYFPWRFS